jgi:hypothetical protein
MTASSTSSVHFLSLCAKRCCNWVFEVVLHCRAQSGRHIHFRRATISSLDFNPTRVCNPTTGRAGAFARSLDFNQRGRIPPHPKMAPELARRHPRGLLGFFRFPELGLREVIVAG